MDPETDEISLIESALTIITIIGFLFRRLFALFADNIILMACFTLYIPVKGLTNMTKKSTLGHVHIASILKGYYALKDLSSLINDALGDVILWAMLDNILFYSYGFPLVIISSEADYVLCGWLLIFLAIGIAIVGISGEMCQQVGKNILNS